MHCDIGNNISIVLKWYIAINKRLLKRFEFIAMLISLPLLVMGLMWVSRQDKGLLNIGIVTESVEKTAVSEVVDKLTSQKSVISFHLYSEENVAREELLKGRLSAVWILPQSLDKIDRGSIKVIQSENNSAAGLAKEKLYSLLYPYIAHSVYINYMNKINIYDNDKLDEYFNRIKVDEDFIKFQSIEGENPYDKLDYITYPVRGFMCIWLFVGVEMSCIYFLYDERKGLFAMMDIQQKRLIAPVYSIGISLNLSLVMLCTLFISGQVGNIFNESISMVFLLASLILFVNIIKSIFTKPEHLEALMFPGILFMIILSPIIFDIRMFGIMWPARLNPIYYYLNSVADSGYFADFGIFIIALILVNAVLGFARRKG